MAPIQYLVQTLSMYIINALFPVVLIALLGYLARHRHWLSEPEGAAIERISFWFLVPCLLFHGAATAQFPADMHWGYLGGFYLVVVLVYGAGMAAGRWLFGYNLRELSIFGMGGAYANATVLGVPVILGVLGPAALVPMLVIVCVHNLMIFSLGTALAEWNSPSRTVGDGGATAWLVRLWRVVTEMLLNPISSSLLAGALFNLVGLHLPGLLDKTLDLLSAAAIPGSVFGLGAALTRYRIHGEIGKALLMVVIKLLLMPALMWWLMTHVFSVDPFWMKTAVLIAAMPVGISVYIFARRHERCETVAATAIVLSSLLSVATITFWVWWLNQPVLS